MQTEMICLGTEYNYVISSKQINEAWRPVNGREFID
jgi:hypothetical protein